MNRKLDMYFGPFEFHAPIRVEDAIKRYVTNNSSRFIQVDDHLIKKFRLETAANKINKKVRFTPIEAILETTNAIIPGSKRLQMPSYVSIDDDNFSIPTTSAEVSATSAEISTTLAEVPTTSAEVLQSSVEVPKLQSVSNKREQTSTAPKKNCILD